MKKWSTGNYIAFASLLAFILLGVLQLELENPPSTYIRNFWSNILGREQPPALGVASIYYYANGGINAPNGFDVAKDSIGIVNFNHPRESENPTKFGYIFIGWLLNNDYNSHDIDLPRQSISIGTKRPYENSMLRYYAQWIRE